MIETVIRLEVGMKFKTSYGDERWYWITDIERGCNCPLYVDEINMDNPPNQPDHVHITCTDKKSKTPFYVNYYSEETLRHVAHPEDFLILAEDQEPTQSTLF